jgi:hypothetical protein
MMLDRAEWGLKGSQAWPEHVVKLYTVLRRGWGEFGWVPAVRGKAKTALAAVNTDLLPKLCSTTQ